MSNQLLILHSTSLPLLICIQPITFCYIEEILPHHDRWNLLFLHCNPFRDISWCCEIQVTITWFSAIFSSPATGKVGRRVRQKFDKSLFSFVVSLLKILQISNVLSCRFVNEATQRFSQRVIPFRCQCIMCLRFIGVMLSGANIYESSNLPNTSPHSDPRPPNPTPENLFITVYNFSLDEMKTTTTG